MMRAILVLALGLLFGAASSAPLATPAAGAIGGPATILKLTGQPVGGAGVSNGGGGGSCFTAGGSWSGNMAALGDATVTFQCAYTQAPASTQQFLVRLDNPAHSMPQSIFGRVTVTTSASGSGLTYTSISATTFGCDATGCQWSWNSGRPWTAAGTQLLQFYK